MRGCTRVAVVTRPCLISSLVRSGGKHSGPSGLPGLVGYELVAGQEDPASAQRAGPRRPRGSCPSPIHFRPRGWHLEEFFVGGAKTGRTLAQTPRLGQEIQAQAGKRPDEHRCRASQSSEGRARRFRRPVTPRLPAASGVRHRNFRVCGGRRSGCGLASHWSHTPDRTACGSAASRAKIDVHA